MMVHLPFNIQTIHFKGRSKLINESYSSHLVFIQFIQNVVVSHYKSKFKYNNKHK